MALKEYASINEIKRRIENDCEPFLISPVGGRSDYCLYEWSDIEDILDTVPTVDLTDGRAKGEWLDLDENFETTRPPFATCSCCGGVSYVDVLHLRNETKILTNFCGQCGAELEYKGS